MILSDGMEDRHRRQEWDEICITPSSWGDSTLTLLPARMIARRDAGSSLEGGQGLRIRHIGP
jgi:hypothetical protein